ncbi:hypothetical protein AHAS_Ahas20G0132100 [Arachis hypogaea]
METLIPVEIKESSPRFILGTFDQEVEKDLVDEVWELAYLREIAFKQKLALRYNQSVKKRAFEEGDLVLRHNDIRIRKPGEGKLSPN